MTREQEARWWRKHFPSASARDAADRAVDELSVDRSMADFIDAWIAAYIAAGGKTGLSSPSGR